MARIRRKPMAEINMVPFIDIMMVLLVAFMVSTPMLTQTVKVDLPKTVMDSAPAVSRNDIVIISVQKDGHYFVDIGPNKDKAIDLTTLIENVSKVVQVRPSIQVLIQGDTTVPYGTVVQVMGQLQQAGVYRVGLVTDPALLEG